MNPGIITIAVGDDRYVEMAKALARSLEHSGTHFPRAVITDRPESELDRYFHHVVYREDCPKSYLAKLYLFRQPIFDCNVFIDADCIVYGSLHSILANLKGTPFKACGRPVLKDWSGVTLDFVRSLYPKVEEYIIYHSGFMYFEQCNQVHMLFETALEVETALRAKGFLRIPDELILSIAAAACRLNSYWIKDPSIISPAWKWDGRPRLDVAKGLALTSVGKRQVMSRIVHFGSENFGSGLYQREIETLATLIPSCSLAISPMPPTWDDGSQETNNAEAKIERVHGE